MSKKWLLDEQEEQARAEVVDLLTEQITMEEALVNLYEKTAGDIQSLPVKHILHMIALDSMKHIDICQAVIAVLQGEEVLTEERTEIYKGLAQHIAMEKTAIDNANKALRNVWIDESKGLKELIKKWRNDEKDHHKWLRRLAGGTFIRMGDRLVSFRSVEEMEATYKRLKKYRKQ